MLKEFTKEDMLKDANRNFYEAKKYLIEIITEKRNSMLDKVVESIHNKNNLGMM